MAKVSELIDQANALEAEGEIAKALAIYRHILPHLKSAPAVAADLSLKAGDLTLKSGDVSGAVQWYGRAGDLCARMGNAEAVINAAERIQNANPDKTDVYLTLGRRMVDAGHAGPAVDVLIQHAKHANLQQMADELQALAGRPTEDVKPLVSMLLEGVVAAPPPPPPSAPLAGPPPPPALAPVELPTWAAPPPGAAPPEPLGPPAPVLPPPPPLPTWAAPPPPVPATPTKPQFAPAPLPPPPEIAPALMSPTVTPDGIDVGQVLPPTVRESQTISQRQSQLRVSRPVEQPRPPVEEPPPPPPPRRSRPQRRSATIPEPRQRGGWGGMILLMVTVTLGVGGWLMYTGRIAAPGPLAGLVARARQPVDSAATKKGASRPAAAARDAAGPDFTPPPPEASPSIVIQGLAIQNFRLLSGNTGGFRVLQRQNTGELITLVARPLADTVGEPAEGEFRLDSIHGDTTTGTTAFQGYVVTLRGSVGPTTMRELLRHLVSKP